MKDSRKVAIVTGGARGLGRAMTLGLSKAEIDVAALDLPASDRELGEVVYPKSQPGGEISTPGASSNLAAASHPPNQATSSENASRKIARLSGWARNQKTLER